MNSNFTSIDIKAIRACIADLRSAPTIMDAPLKYSRVEEQNTIEIRIGPIKIICQIISSLDSPRDNQIERLKILKILNTDLQIDLKQNRNKN